MLKMKQKGSPSEQGRAGTDQTQVSFQRSILPRQGVVQSNKALMNVGAEIQFKRKQQQPTSLVSSLRVGLLGKQRGVEQEMMELIEAIDAAVPVVDLPSPASSNIQSRFLSSPNLSSNSLHPHPHTAESLAALQNILERLKKDHAPADLRIWISQGLFSRLIDRVCYIGKEGLTADTDILVDIIRHLIIDNKDACTVLCNKLIKHLATHIDCVGVSELLYTLLSIDKLKDAFLQDFGVSRLIELYMNISNAVTTNPWGDNDDSFFSEVNTSREAQSDSTRFHGTRLLDNPPVRPLSSAPSIMASKNNHQNNNQPSFPSHHQHPSQNGGDHAGLPPPHPGGRHRLSRTMGTALPPLPPTATTTDPTISPRSNTDRDRPVAIVPGRPRAASLSSGSRDTHVHAPIPSFAPPSGPSASPLMAALTAALHNAAANANNSNGNDDITPSSPRGAISPTSVASSSSSSSTSQSPSSSSVITFNHPFPPTATSPPLPPGMVPVSLSASTSSPTTPKINSAGADGIRPFVPKLNLPLRMESPMKLHQSTRSSRRHHAEGLPSSTRSVGVLSSFDAVETMVQSPVKELQDLATKLGETFAAADLTALMAYKHALDKHLLMEDPRPTFAGTVKQGAASIPNNLSVHRRSIYIPKKFAQDRSTSLLGGGGGGGGGGGQHGAEWLRSPMARAMCGRGMSFSYRTKANLLQALAIATAHPQDLIHVRSPISLLFTELFENYTAALTSSLFSHPITNSLAPAHLHQHNNNNNNPHHHLPLHASSNSLTSGRGQRDPEHRVLMLQILGNWALYVEFCHRTRWHVLTKGMPLESRESYRKKLDRLVWRAHNSMCSSLEGNRFDDVNITLQILADYAETCPSRIMSSQVVDVCMETLLKVKQQVFYRVGGGGAGGIPMRNMADLRTMNLLLVIFDVIAQNNRHPPLNELLLAIFVERDDTFSIIKQYTIQILRSHSLEAEFTHTYGANEGQALLHQSRVRVVKHYHVCVEMIQRQAETEFNSFTPAPPPPPPPPPSMMASSSSSSSSSPASAPAGQYSSRTDRGGDYSSDHLMQRMAVIDQFKKMEFLLLPAQHGGPLLQFLQQGSRYEHHETKRAMLEFMCAVFATKWNPFVKKKTFIDTYISYFYIGFIRLYNSFVLDPITLELCRLHLRLLFAFALNKNDKITMKFYQLRVMDFLVREINLEQEIKENRDGSAPAPNHNNPVPFFFSPSPMKRAKPTKTTAAGSTSVTTPATGSSSSDGVIKKTIPSLNLAGSMGGGGGGGAVGSPVPKLKLGLGGLGGLGAKLPPPTAAVDDPPAATTTTDNNNTHPVATATTTMGDKGEKEPTPLVAADPTPPPPSVPAFKIAIPGLKLGLGLIKGGEPVAKPVEPPKSVEPPQPVESPKSIDKSATSDDTPTVKEPPKEAPVPAPAPVPAFKPSAVPALKLGLGLIKGGGEPLAKPVEPPKSVEQPKPAEPPKPVENLGGNLMKLHNEGSASKLSVSPKRSRGRSPEPRAPSPTPSPSSSPSQVRRSISPKRPEQTPPAAPTQTAGGGGKKVPMLKLGRGSSSSLLVPPTTAPAPAPAPAPVEEPATPAPAPTAPTAEPLKEQQQQAESTTTTATPAPAAAEGTPIAVAPPLVRSKSKLQVPILRLGLGAASSSPSSSSSTNNNINNSETTTTLQVNGGSPRAAAAANGTGTNLRGINPTLLGKAPDFSEIDPSSAFSTSFKDFSQLGLVLPKPTLHASTPNNHPSSSSSSSLSTGAPTTPVVLSSSMSVVEGNNKTSSPVPSIGGVPKLSLGVPKLTIPALKKLPKDEPEMYDQPDKKHEDGSLSAIEQRIDVNDPKFQLVLDNAGGGGGGGGVPGGLGAFSSMMGSSTGSLFGANGANPVESMIERLRYINERESRKIYHSKGLHVAFLELVFSLLLTTNHTLEPLYVDQFPLNNKKMNIPFILHLHVNHPSNEEVISELLAHTHTTSSPYFRLLKLLCVRLFNPDMYTGLTRIGKGAFGVVYKGIWRGGGTKFDVAAKLMPVSTNIGDRCVLHDIFTEILILDSHRGDARSCRMYDYGLDGENYWIVMKPYKCSLKKWRSEQTAPLSKNLPLYLNIFMRLLNSVQFLTDYKVNHFDIKLDNFLAHPTNDGVPLPQSSTMMTSSNMLTSSPSPLMLSSTHLQQQQRPGVNLLASTQQQPRNIPPLLGSMHHQLTSSEKDLNSFSTSNSSNESSSGSFSAAVLEMSHLQHQQHQQMIAQQIEEEFWRPKGAEPGFDVVLADFGEAKVYTSELEGYTTRNRGTEFIKSPEMLMVAYASQKTRETYDRRKKIGANSASDVWSLGCLLYELLTGDFLFYEDDWMLFWIRVTSPGQELLTPESLAKIDNNEELVEFFNFVFQRDPFYRPTLRDLTTKFGQVQTAILERLARQKISGSSYDNLNSLVPTPERSHVTSSRSRPGTPSLQPSSNGKVGVRSSIGTGAHASGPMDSARPDTPSLRGSQVVPSNIKVIKLSPLTPTSSSSSSTPSVMSPPPLSLAAALGGVGTSSSSAGPSVFISSVAPPINPPPTYIHYPFFVPIELQYPPTLRYVMKTCTPITPHVLISAYEPALQWKYLMHTEHITHIVNTTPHPNPWPSHFEYLHIPIQDNPSFDIAPIIPKVNAFIKAAISQKGKVLIFSEKGVSRCAALAIGYLMQSGLNNKSFHEAYVHVLERRYTIEPNLGFLRSLGKLVTTANNKPATATTPMMASYVASAFKHDI